MIEGEEIRLLHSGPTPDSREAILVAMRGEKGGDGIRDGPVEKIVELQETSEISSNMRTPTTAMPASMWEEWDM